MPENEYVDNPVHVPVYNAVHAASSPCVLVAAGNCVGDVPDCEGLGHPEWGRFSLFCDRLHHNVRYAKSDFNFKIFMGVPDYANEVFEAISLGSWASSGAPSSQSESDSEDLDVLLAAAPAAVPPRARPACSSYCSPAALSSSSRPCPGCPCCGSGFKQLCWRQCDRSPCTCWRPE